jgi:hypothetical protein
LRSLGALGALPLPHNNDIDVSDAFATFRTLFVAPAADVDEVREKIDRALQEGTGWAVLRTWPRPVAAVEQLLAGRLAATPSK